MHSHKGFTLVELMVVVAIIGVLTAVGLPAYQDYIITGRIPDATSNLASRRVQMEQFFQDNRTYANAPACPTTADTATSAYFNFSCVAAADASTFTLQAVGKGSMLGFVYTINQSNVKATTSVPANWTTSTTCWVTRKGGAC